MAKNKNQKGQQVKQTSKSVELSLNKNNNRLFIIGAILLITFICFFPALSKTKEFTNWDDPVYVVNLADKPVIKVQPQIEKLDGEHIKTMFSTKNDVSLNYHPLTMLSLAVNYKFAKKVNNTSEPSPFGFVLTNILFHLLNTLLVFIFLYRLSGKKFWVGAISALLFGIHPMHVESVAWISERKDVLYCFFFLASCITYISYIETKRILFIIACFALFLLSCLSKAMAVPLPLVLLLIDFYLQRKFSVKTILEKLPFFLLALWIGYMAVHIQSKEAIAEFKVFTLPQRFMFAGYGFMMYWEKLFFPIGLTAFYKYPSLTNDGGVPTLYHFAPVAALLIAIVPVYLAYKKNNERFRLFLFGIGFFSIMVALVLQFISVGAAIMADRYSYLPYIGAFFIIASLVNNFFENKKTKQNALGVLILVTAALGYGCYSRVQVWNDSEKLWTDVMEKDPYIIEQKGNVVSVVQVGVDNAYKNRGNYYREHGQMEKAFNDYKVLVDARVHDAGAYANMGNFYGLKGKDAQQANNKKSAEEMFTKALDMYSEAIKYKQNNFEAFMNRAITYSIMGQHQKAIEDYYYAMKVDPSATNLYANVSYEKLQLHDFKGTIEDCNKATAINPNDANILYYRGTALINLGNYTDAIKDLNTAVQLKTLDQGTTANAFYNLSLAYSKIGNKQMALQAAMSAKQAGYPNLDDYIKGLQ